MKKLTQKGFTIIELMIASLVFTSLLLLCLEGITRVAKVYVKNSSISRTNEFVRTLSEDISQQIKYGLSEPSIGGSAGVKYFCGGGYAYRIALNTNTSAIKRDINSTCADYTNDTSYNDAETISPAQLRVLVFSITNTPPSLAWEVKIRASIGDPDLLKDSAGKYLTDANPDFTTVKCIPNLAGSEYCAVIELTTVVTRRLS